MIKECVDAQIQPEKKKQTLRGREEDFRSIGEKRGGRTRCDIIYELF